jgi:hypothetical protein
VILALTIRAAPLMWRVGAAQDDPALLGPVVVWKRPPPLTSKP